MKRSRRTHTALESSGVEAMFESDDFAASGVRRRWSGSERRTRGVVRRKTQAEAKRSELNVLKAAAPGH
jgi:hypothetical protein